MNPTYTRFEFKSSCCNYDVEYYRGVKVGYIMCLKCGKACQTIEPSNTIDKFVSRLLGMKQGLNYYEPNRTESMHNYEKMQLIEQIIDIFESTFKTAKTSEVQQTINHE